MFHQRAPSAQHESCLLLCYLLLYTLPFKSKGKCLLKTFSNLSPEEIKETWQFNEFFVFLSNLTNLLFLWPPKLLMEREGRTTFSKDITQELWSSRFHLSLLLPASLDDAPWAGSNTGGSGHPDCKSCLNSPEPALKSNVALLMNLGHCTSKTESKEREQAWQSASLTKYPLGSWPSNSWHVLSNGKYTNQFPCVTFTYQWQS